MKNKQRLAMVLLSALMLSWSYVNAEDERGEEAEKQEKKGHEARGKNKQTAPSTPVSTDPVYQKECGSCHFPFPVGMLPERSWRAMLANLSNHFGEDATLPVAELKQVLTYAVANAGERSKSRQDRHVASSVPTNSVPQRISETPYFVKEHKEAAGHIKPKGPVSSWSSCPLCHTKAEAGSFNEDEVKIPKVN